ncbi:MAG: hypothetical protein ACOYXB_04555 [Bacteroidota bacterium]
MKKTATLILSALTLFYFLTIILKKDKLLESTDNPEYQSYIADYRQEVEKKMKELAGEEEKLKNYRLEYRGRSSSGTTGNFEGPQVHLKGIRFHDEYLDREDQRLLHLDAVSAHFDPDHACYGLPDVSISIQDVRLYDPRSKISQFLAGDQGKPEPYKVFRKKIATDTSGTSKYLVMQLWLTEFKVTVDIRPDKECFVRITDDEKINTTYPGFWYGSSQAQVRLKDLRREYQDSRYGNLSFILEIIPDNSPVYYASSTGSATKADFAIAAIYCEEALIGNEPEVQRISTNIHSGQPVFLNNDNDYGQMNTNPMGFSESIEANAGRLMDLKALDNSFIWNKPYYIKLFFNNLGTWRSGIVNQNVFHDQVTYRFIMPVFVVGSWDVIAPQEILPGWNPPEPYIRKVTLKSFLPFGNLGFGGKLVSWLLILGIAGLGLYLGVPGLFKKAA